MRRLRRLDERQEFVQADYEGHADALELGTGVVQEGDERLPLLVVAEDCARALGTWLPIDREDPNASRLDLLHRGYPR